MSSVIVSTAIALACFIAFCSPIKASPIFSADGDKPTHFRYSFRVERIEFGDPKGDNDNGIEEYPECDLSPEEDSSNDYTEDDSDEDEGFYYPPSDEDDDDDDDDDEDDDDDDDSDEDDDVHEDDENDIVETYYDGYVIPEYEYEEDDDTGLEVSEEEEDITSDEDDTEDSDEEYTLDEDEEEDAFPEADDEDENTIDYDISDEDSPEIDNDDEDISEDNDFTTEGRYHSSTLEPNYEEYYDQEYYNYLNADSEDEEERKQRKGLLMIPNDEIVTVKNTKKRDGQVRRSEENNIHSFKSNTIPFPTWKPKIVAKPGSSLGRESLRRNPAPSRLLHYLQRRYPNAFYSKD